MASPAQAPADAGGPVQHTHLPPGPLGRLSPEQVAFLLKGIGRNRIGTDGKGFSHVEAWDIRRYLIRVFGFGGFDTDLIEMTLVHERSEQRQKKDRDGRPYGDPYTAWTVVYRVAMRLTVKVDGIELGHWHGVATGDASNQPSIADAHDLALKTADSQALKRAATNLGDQFGLSLYNSGSVAPVVEASFAYLKAQDPPKAITDDDAPVNPEPAPEAPPESVPAAPAGPGRAETAEDIADAVAALKEKIRNGWGNELSTIQNLIEAQKKGIDQEMTPSGPDGPLVTFEHLLKDRIDALRSAKNGSTTNATTTGRAA